ncbi:hypothetical protein ACFW1A_25865 [Kitasatospora sp. NPDC058965]|uniref:hypothetical protein n=1 Tax=Kitasatospora sp. NPDC058965 TaxID=3346682 RepID=UPI0036A3657C
MTTKRGDRVAPPPGDGEFDVRAASSEAGKGWDDLCQQARSNALAAWKTMRTNPSPVVQTPRHSRLKHKLASGSHRGQSLPQWQIEVTGGGRIWYLVDQDARICWIVRASTGHPKETE